MQRSSYLGTILGSSLSPSEFEVPTKLSASKRKRLIFEDNRERRHREEIQKMDCQIKILEKIANQW